MFKPTFTLAALALSAVFCVALSVKLPSPDIVTKEVTAVERHSSVNDCHHHSYHCFWGWPHDWRKACRSCAHHCAAIAADTSGVTADAVGIQHSQCCQAHLNDGGKRAKIASGQSCRTSHEWMAANRIRQLDTNPKINLSVVSMRQPHAQCTHGNTEPENLYCAVGRITTGLLDTVNEQRDRRRDWALPRNLGGRQGPPPAPAAGFVRVIREDFMERYNLIANDIRDRLNAGQSGWNPDEESTVWYWHLRMGTLDTILDNGDLSDTQKMQQILSAIADN